MDPIYWEEPPPAERIVGTPGEVSELTRWLYSLRELPPGRWARYPDPAATSVTTDIKKGRRAGIDPGEFECVTRRRVEGLPVPKKGYGWLYVRYQGDQR